MAAAAPTINIKLTEFSLPVPSVQELTIQQPGTVPNQYIRDDISDIVTVPSSLRAPLIDMAKLVNPDSRLEQLQKLHSACKEWGVFQLINHGVPDEVIRNIREQAQEFFDLPLQEKQNWAQKPGSLEGYGQAFVLEKEQKLQWKCSSSKLFPSKPESWISGLKNLKASEKHWELMLKKRGKLWFLYREPEKVIGIVPHFDVTGLTLLLECGNVPGIQFRKDGQWIFVAPLEGALTINLGLILEIMSNGIYKAPEHRVVVNGLKERLSINTFCDPHASVNVEPAKELIDSGSHLPRYKSFKYTEYDSLFANWNLEPPFSALLKI